jgi:AraC-like DNA-binding protein
MEYMNVLVWIGFCQALFAAILMFTKKERTVSDKILSAWMVLLSIEFLTCGIDYLLFQRPLLSGSHLLFNAALYLYVRSLTEAGFRLKYLQLIHLIPFLLFEIMAYIIQEPLALGDYLVYDDNYLFRLSFALINLISWLIYSALSISLIHKYRVNLLNEKSNIERNENIKWLVSVTTFYVVYCILEFVLSYFLVAKGYHSMTPHIFNYSLLLVLVYMLSFYGLLQKNIPEQLLVAKDRKQYKKPLLNDRDRNAIGKKVLEFFDVQQAYLNPDLSMEVLAAELNVPKHQLTEVLNTGLGKSFFHLVNSYRVEAVKKMLADPGNNYSIEAIGYECGFSNKSSFYKIFKETVGKTPVEYRDSLSCA